MNYARTMHLLYILLILLLVTRIGAELAVRLKQPALVGELLGGVLLGLVVVAWLVGRYLLPFIGGPLRKLASDHSELSLLIIFALALSMPLFLLLFAIVHFYQDTSVTVHEFNQCNASFVPDRCRPNGLKRGLGASVASRACIVHRRAAT